MDFQPVEATPDSHLGRVRAQREQWASTLAERIEERRVLLEHRAETAAQIAALPARSSAEQILQAAAAQLAAKKIEPDIARLTAEIDRLRQLDTESIAEQRVYESSTHAARSAVAQARAALATVLEQSRRSIHSMTGIRPTDDEL